MNFLPFLSGLAAPNDLWSILINWIRGGVGNLGWTILLVTILVKAITLPLDFMSKFTQKRQNLIQQKCAPEVAKLQKKFGSDRQRLQVQTNALYKREGLKMGTGCIVMLVNMVLTMVIFFTFFASLRDMSAYEAITQYEKVESSYTTTFYNSMIDEYNDLSTNEEVEIWIEQYQNESKYLEANPGAGADDWATFVETNKPTVDAITEKASKAAVDTWNSNKASWLWVKNIWVADATTSPFPNYKELVKMASNANKEYKAYVETNITESNYNGIANLIQSNETKNNGFFILTIIIGITTYATQFIADLHNKLKNKNANLVSKQANPQSNMSMKMMQIILPIVMILFALSSSASFGIYLLASNIASIAFGEVVTLIVNKMTKKKQEEVEAVLEKEALRLMKKGKLQG